MDVSALPYLLYFMVELVAFLVGLGVQTQKPRKVVGYALAWVGASLLRNLLILLSAGSAGTFSREAVVFYIRSLVVVEAVIMVLVLIFFLRENVNFGKPRATAPTDQDLGGA